MTEIAFTEFSGRGASPDRNVPALIDNPRISRSLSQHAARDFRIVSNGPNKLLESAMPLLGAAIRLRGLYNHTEVAALHAHLANEVQAFERVIESEGYEAATVVAARYCVCAMLDEAALSQQWGAESLWAERPLLSVFHNETWGGEKVFAILDRVISESHRFSDLMELVYYCIGLGFEGKFHVMHNGQAKLHELMEAVYRQLERQQGEAPVRLTEPEINIVNRPQQMARRLPLWAIPIIGMGSLVAIYFAFATPLDQHIERISATIKNALVEVEGSRR